MNRRNWFIGLVSSIAALFGFKHANAKDIDYQKGWDELSSFIMNSYGVSKTHDSSKNYPLGPDRRQWFKMGHKHHEDVKWIPVEIGDVKPKDIILSCDIISGYFSNIEIMICEEPRKDRIIIEENSLINLDYIL